MWHMLEIGIQSNETTPHNLCDLKDTVTDGLGPDTPACLQLSSGVHARTNQSCSGNKRETYLIGV